MTIKITTRFPLPGTRLRALSMRRLFIYPHRSVRSLRLTTGQALLALATAAALVVLVAKWQGNLFSAHNRLCLVLLELSGIPVSGVETVDLFPGLAPAPVPATPTVRLDERPAFLAIAFGIALMLLLMIHRLFPLARGFLLFLLTLLFVPAIIVAFFPARQFGSAEFGQIWLRGEALVWLLLPVFSAGIITLLHPAGVLGVVWAVIVQAFGFLWSAVRLALFLGIMHFSGILFVPLLWFAFGILADMVYFMVCYSMAIHWLAVRSWGRGAQ